MGISPDKDKIKIKMASKDRIPRKASDTSWGKDSRKVKSGEKFPKEGNKFPRQSPKADKKSPQKLLVQNTVTQVLHPRRREGRRARIFTR